MKDQEKIRKIIHIDMDAFFASVEQKDNPDLRGKPIAVGGGSARGVVAAASYEARAYGVRSAMSGMEASRRCPKLIFVRSRFDRYKEISQKIMHIFKQYTDIVEPLSIDEAFLDVTENKKNIPYAMTIAEEIRERIFNELGLTASAGVSYNKFLSKIASDVNKPNGMYVITPKRALDFIDNLPIEKFYGVGRVTARKMHRIGVRKGVDLRQLSRVELVSQFGKIGHFYYGICRGIDPRVVQPFRIRKSVGTERTFTEDIQSEEQVFDELGEIAKELFRRSVNRNIFGYTLTLKVKFNDFSQITRSQTGTEVFTTLPEIEEEIYTLWGRVESQKPIRLLGLSLSNLDNENLNEEVLDAQLVLPFEEIL